MGDFLKENWLFILFPLLIVLAVVLFLITREDPSQSGFHYNI